MAREGYVVGKTGRRKGDQFERSVCADQERIGRVAFRVRQGGGEPVDVVALEPGRMFFIQCKSGKPYMLPAEREAFVLKARLVDAVPLMAFREGREIRYRKVDA